MLVKTILVPSGEKMGLVAPVVVMALKEGTEGKRVATARVTTSASTCNVLVQTEKPCFLISTLYVPGVRLMVVSVAEVSLPLMYIWAPSGKDLRTSSPVG